MQNFLHDIFHVHGISCGFRKRTFSGGIYQYFILQELEKMTDLVKFILTTLGKEYNNCYETKLKAGGLRKMIISQ